MDAASLLLLAASLVTADGAASSTPIQVDQVVVTLIEEVEVPAQEVGVLAKLNVHEGQLVEKGDLLAQLEEIDARLKREQAVLELEIAREKATNDVSIRFARKKLEVSQQELKRAVEANQRVKNTVSQSEIDQRRLAAERDELEIEQAQHNQRIAALEAELKASDVKMTERELERRRIIAPLSGVVVQVKRRQGEWVQPGDAVFRILRLNRLRSEGFISAKDLEADLVGRPVTLTVDLPGRPRSTMKGTVVFVSPEISPVNNQVRFWAEFDNPDLLLKPGMKGSLSIQGTPSALSSK